MTLIQSPLLNDRCKRNVEIDQLERNFSTRPLPVKRSSQLGDTVMTAS